MKRPTPKKPTPQAPPKVISGSNGGASGQPTWTPSAAAASESTLRHLVYAPAQQFAEDSSGGPPPPPSTCKLESFDTPANRSGPKVEPKPDGTYTVFEMFYMNAEFSSTGSGECRCCEYRQYIRGHARYRDPGKDWVNADPTLSPTVYREDRDKDGRAYGYRNQPQKLTDKYLPLPRATGCSYQGIDVPQLSGLIVGSQYDIVYEFKGEIIDVCNEDRVVATRTWTVTLQGTIP